MLATMRDKLGYSGMESSSQLSLNKTKKPVVLQERPIIHTKVSGIAELAVKYNIGEEIGKGNFGVVLSVIDKFTGKTWAMKVIEKKKRNRAKMKALTREIQILKIVSHPHIIYMDRVFESIDNIYLVLELCHGDLWLKLTEIKAFREPEAKRLVMDILEAVAYLHKNDIVHRDLKMENILLSENPRDQNDKLFIKISDFGLSIIKSGSGLENMLHDFCGTLTYMSPEIILSRSYSQQCDVWSVGIILYMLVTGKYPFYSTNERELEKKIINDDILVPDFLTPHGANLLKKMLAKNPAIRITAAEALRHPWIANNPTNQNQDTILEMMERWRMELSSNREDIQDLYDLPPSVTMNKSQAWDLTSIDSFKKSGEESTGGMRKNSERKGQRTSLTIAKQTDLDPRAQMRNKKK